MPRFATLVGICFVVAAAACSSSAKTSVSTSPTTSTITGIPVGPDSSTTAPGATTTKQCVGLKDTLPAGSPAMPLTAGPAPTTLGKQDLKVGTGAVVQPGATVTANYVGVACTTGKIFDSSYAHGQAVQFPLDQVIPGWTNGIPGMKVGGVRLLSIPADQAYGANPPQGAGIAPNEPLFFLVEITATS